MQLTTKGLIIKVMDIKENDRLITILTADFGLIRAFATSAKKSSNKNHNSTTLFCYCDFLLNKSGDIYKVKEANLISSFFKLSSDIVNLSLAQYFCELAGVMAPEDTNATEHLRLTLNSLNFLCEAEKDINLLKALFELRILTISGFMPDLTACSCCGKFEDDIMCFYYEDGSILCNECKEEGKFSYIDKTLLSALRHIVYADFSRLFSFTVPKEHAVKLSKITEEYLLFQTDRNYKTLNFFKSII